MNSNLGRKSLAMFTEKRERERRRKKEIKEKEF